jgi:ubiquitin C-terminal hydrolase
MNQAEVLVIDDMTCVCRKCPRCKCHRSAVKSLGIWRLPPVLIIHLKRFTFAGPFRDKLQALVSGMNLS